MGPISAGSSIGFLTSQWTTVLQKSSCSKGSPNGGRHNGLDELGVAVLTENLSPAQGLLHSIAVRGLQKTMGHLLGEGDGDRCGADVLAAADVAEPSLLGEGVLGVAQEPGRIHEGGHVVLGQQMAGERAKLPSGVVRIGPPFLRLSEPVAAVAAERRQTVDKRVAVGRTEARDDRRRVQKVGATLDVQQQQQQGGAALAGVGRRSHGVEATQVIRFELVFSDTPGEDGADGLCRLAGVRPPFGQSAFALQLREQLELFVALASALVEGIAQVVLPAPAAIGVEAKRLDMGVHLRFGLGLGARLASGLALPTTLPPRFGEGAAEAALAAPASVLLHRAQTQ